MNFQIRGRRGEDEVRGLTRQVDIAGGALRLNETEAAALSLAFERAGGPDIPVEIGLREAADAAGVTEAASRRAFRSLERRGLLAVEERYSADGGRRANAYALTVMGALAAAAIRNEQ